MHRSHSQEQEAKPRKARIDGNRLLTRLEQLAAIGADPAGGVTRLAYSPEDVRARSLVAGWMTQAGLSVRIDPAGNLIGRLPGAGRHQAALVLGSHLDTVLAGGPLDGAYGVLAAVEAADTVQRHGLELAHDLVVVAFSNEEGARGTPGMVGAKAIAGALTAADLNRADDDGVTLSVDYRGAIIEAAGDLAIAADGVWSTMRGTDGRTRHAFSGLTAWRTTLQRGGAAERPDSVLSGSVVTAFLNRRFHLVSYPIRAGQAVNLVAVTRGGALAQSWSVSGSKDEFASAFSGAPALARLLADAGPWTRWPLHVVDPDGPWTSERGIALIGDAAHATTPFAAQGAAMAIEDADVLASALHRNRNDLPAALALYERERKPRVKRVVRRGAFNRFVWHASGPVALGRDIVLKLRSPERTMADFDWLYGWGGPKPSD